jgi:hypothetical protein
MWVARLYFDNLIFLGRSILQPHRRRAIDSV